LKPVERVKGIVGRKRRRTGWRQEISLPQFKKVRTLCTLAEKSAIQRGVPQLRRLGIKQNAKENSRRIRAMRLGCRNFLIAPRDELKESISLVQGHIPDAILKVERERCPRARSR
jgi:hypothetical protein